MIDLLPLQRLFAAVPALDLACALAAAALAAAAIRLRARPEAAALCLAGLSLALGLPMAADGFLHAWDERYHALVARNLLAHPLLPTLVDAPLAPLGPDWTDTRVWLHKPPLALWLMALGRALFGPGELALRVPSLLLHAAAVLAVARLGPALFGEARGRRIGLWAAGLFALHGELLALASGRVPTDHPDSVVISLTAIAGLCAVRAAASAGGAGRGGDAGAARLALLAGAVTGAAFLAKSFPGLLALGLLAAALDWRRPLAAARALGLAALACAAVALPWQLWTRHAFPAEAAHEAAYALRHFTIALEGHAGGPLFHLERLTRFFGEACPAALLWFLLRRRALGDGARLVALWLIAPYAVFSLAATKMDAYPLVAAPAVCLAIGAALEVWLEAARGLRERPPARAGLLLLCAALVLLPARFAAERLRPLQRDPEALQRAEGLLALARRLGPGPGLLAPVAEPIEAMFYTGWTALPRAPTPAERERARALGWRIEAP